MNTLSRYFSGSGRVSKGVWLSRLVAATACATALGMLAQSLAGPVACALVTAVFLVSASAISVQRLHDLGMPGRWLGLVVVPIIGPLWLLIKLLSRGTAGDNCYGTDPRSRHNYLQVNISK